MLAIFGLVQATSEDECQHYSVRASSFPRFDLPPLQIASNQEGRSYGVNVSRLTFKLHGVRTGGEGRRLAELLRYVRVLADAQVVVGACPSPTRGECAIHDSIRGISAHAGTGKLPRTRSCGPNILAELSQSPVPRRHAAMAIAELRAPPGFPS